jgi:dimeric dUTPase (all-alpha-NTP-PPase superfamily)
MDIFKTLDKMSNRFNIGALPDIEIDQLKATELSAVIDYELWLETIELQKEFNTQVAPDWASDRLGKKYNFWMGILDETAEVLNSRHWKWWKNRDQMGNVDWDNVKVELIDIFHFTLSICIQNNMENTLFMQLVNLEMNKDNTSINHKVKDPEFFDDFWEEFLMAVQMKLLPVLIIRLVEYWYRAGGDANTLFREYRIKAALNKIRQEFGYSSKNSYEKMWPNKSGKMVEDNVMAVELTKDIPIDKDTVDNMKKVLRDYYLQNIAI